MLSRVAWAVREDTLVVSSFTINANIPDADSGRPERRLLLTLMSFEFAAVFTSSRATVPYSFLSSTKCSINQDTLLSPLMDRKTKAILQRYHQDWSSWKLQFERSKLRPWGGPLTWKAVRSATPQQLVQDRHLLLQTKIIELHRNSAKYFNRQKGEDHYAGFFQERIFWVSSRSLRK